MHRTHAQTPHIRLKHIHIVVPMEHLRRIVVPLNTVQGRTRGDTRVGDFDTAVEGEEDVDGGDAAMPDRLFLEVGEAEGGAAQE